MLHKTSLSKKLFFSNLLYGIPVVVLMILMVKAKNKDISFAEYEMHGNEYQRPVEELFQSITAYKVAWHRAAFGDPRSMAALNEMRRKVDESFSAVEKVNGKLGEALQFTEAGLKQRKRENLSLQEVKKRWGMAKEGSDQQLASLVADLRGMITHLGDTSNLILDPDLDSYYLMDVTLIALPQLQDRIQEVAVFVGGILQRRQITVEERIQVNTSRK